MRKLNLRIDTFATQTIWCVLLLAVSANGANLTVVSGGGGNFTTIQACANAMAAGDTCIVYAGTYNENVTVPAGTAGNYKTVTVNGSDVVGVTSFTLGSHTKLIGNCSTPASVGTCGFSIGGLASATTGTGRACVTIAGGGTDIYIKGNTLYACGFQAMITVASNQSATFIYIQGNTLAYACVASSQAGTSTKECDGILFEAGDHVLIERNDLSHYTLGIDFTTSYNVIRNNTVHDVYESEAGGNAHTDFIFSETGPVGSIVQYNLAEGNFIHNTHGPDAKGILLQNDSPNNCNSLCNYFIERYNILSRTGGAVNSNNGASSVPWRYVKVYNQTYVDLGQDLGNLGYDGTFDTSTSVSNGSYLNSIYYFGSTAVWTANPSGYILYDCGSGVGCNFGYNLFYCAGGTCSPAYGNHGPQAFGSDPHNQIKNPLFVNYVGAGNAANNYHLQGGSPAIAAGTYLTTVASGDSGSGTSLVVNDAAYFQDGYGLSNAYSTVNPDCIAVGTASNHVCVTAVNYTANTLTLASSISRSAGQGVYLYSKSDGVQVLTGNAPDLGAYPYGGGTITGGGPTPPTALTAVVH
jgi:hypothetical protein